MWNRSGSDHLRRRSLQRNMNVFRQSQHENNESGISILEDNSYVSHDDNATEWWKKLQNDQRRYTGMFSPQPVRRSQRICEIKSIRIEESQHIMVVEDNVDEEMNRIDNSNYMASTSNRDSYFESFDSHPSMSAHFAEPRKNIFRKRGYRQNQKENIFSNAITPRPSGIMNSFSSNESVSSLKDRVLKNRMGNSGFDDSYNSINEFPSPKRTIFKKKSYNDHENNYFNNAITMRPSCMIDSFSGNESLDEPYVRNGVLSVEKNISSPKRTIFKKKSYNGLENNYFDRAITMRPSCAIDSFSGNESVDEPCIRTGTLSAEKNISLPHMRVSKDDNAKSNKTANISTIGNDENSQYTRNIFKDVDRTQNNILEATMTSKLSRMIQSNNCKELLISDAESETNVSGRNNSVSNRRQISQTRNSIENMHTSKDGTAKSNKTANNSTIGNDEDSQYTRNIFKGIDRSQNNILEAAMTSKSSRMIHSDNCKELSISDAETETNVSGMNNSVYNRRQISQTRNSIENMHTSKNDTAKLSESTNNSTVGNVEALQCKRNVFKNNRKSQNNNILEAAMTSKSSRMIHSDNCKELSISDAGSETNMSGRNNSISNRRQMSHEEHEFDIQDINETNNASKQQNNTTFFHSESICYENLKHLPSSTIIGDISSLKTPTGRRKSARRSSVDPHSSYLNTKNRTSNIKNKNVKSLNPEDKMKDDNDKMLVVDDMNIIHEIDHNEQELEMRSPEMMRRNSKCPSESLKNIFPFTEERKTMTSIDSLHCINDKSQHTEGLNQSEIDRRYYEEMQAKRTNPPVRRSTIILIKDADISDQSIMEKDDEVSKHMRPIRHSNVPVGIHAANIPIMSESIDEDMQLKSTNDRTILKNSENLACKTSTETVAYDETMDEGIGDVLILDVSDTFVNSKEKSKMINDQTTHNNSVEIPATDTEIIPNENIKINSNNSEIDLTEHIETPLIISKTAAQTFEQSEANMNLIDASQDNKSSEISEKNSTMITEEDNDADILILNISETLGYSKDESKMKNKRQNDHTTHNYSIETLGADTEIIPNENNNENITKINSNNRDECEMNLVEHIESPSIVSQTAAQTFEQSGANTNLIDVSQNNKSSEISEKNSSTITEEDNDADILILNISETLGYSKDESKMKNKLQNDQTTRNYSIETLGADTEIIPNENITKINSNNRDECKMDLVEHIESPSIVSKTADQIFEQSRTSMNLIDTSQDNENFENSEKNSTTVTEEDNSADVLILNISETLGYSKDESKMKNKLQNSEVAISAEMPGNDTEIEKMDENITKIFDDSKDECEMNLTENIGTIIISKTCTQIFEQSEASSAAMTSQESTNHTEASRDDESFDKSERSSTMAEEESDEDRTIVADNETYQTGEYESTSKSVSHKDSIDESDQTLRMDDESNACWEFFGNNSQIPNEDTEESKAELQKVIKKLIRENEIRREKMKKMVREKYVLRPESIKLLSGTEYIERELNKENNVKEFRRKLAAMDRKSKKPAVQNGQIKKKSQKLYMKETWITHRLYNFIQERLRPKYDIKTRIRSERFVKDLATIVNKVMSLKEGYGTYVSMLRTEMVRLKLVVTHHDFHCFIREYLPYHFRIKSIPAYGRDMPEIKGSVFDPIIIESED